MREKRLKGKRYIALARCSSAGQVDTSIDEQLRLIENFGHAHGMCCVDRITLGVTGSVPGLRSDIDQLIQRKREHDDYDYVVVQDFSRLTRSGPAHGLYIVFQLRSVGVEILSVQDALPGGDMGDVMQTLKHYASKVQAEAIAFASTRGASASLYTGKTAHCKAPPFGIDRLYCSEDGKPKHVIRNLTNGTQVKLDPDSGAVLEQFGRNQKTGVPAHYIKQKTESIRLIPGDPEHVRIVVEIFERHVSQGWGYYRIAQDLNDRGIPSPRGRQWSLATVRAILFNPTYVGLGIANLATSAVYYARSSAGPIAASTELKDMMDGRPARRIRPKTEWFERQEPALVGLLPPSLKPAVSAKQSARLEALATGTAAHRNRDRHRDSSYFLKGILTTKQGEHPMTGRTTGKTGHRKRYYAVSRAFTCPSKDNLLRTLIPAEPIERVVVSVLQEALTNCGRVHELVGKLAERELRARRSPASDLTELHQEKTAIERKLAFALDELDSDGRNAVRAKVQQMQARLKEINAEIRRRSHDRQRIENPDEIADAICGTLSELAGQVPSLPRAALRNLLQVFVAKLEVDLKTRQVEVVFALPEWVTADTERLCLVGNSACKTTNEAQPVLVIARYRITWNRRLRSYRQPISLPLKRRDAAA